MTTHTPSVGDLELHYGTGQGFGSRALVVDYLRTKTFPAIHDDILHAMRGFPGGFAGRNVIDLGACTGLLSLRLKAELEVGTVMGLEANVRDVALFKGWLAEHGHPVSVQHHMLDLWREETLRTFDFIVKSIDASVLVGRRIIPEVCTRPTGTTKRPGMPAWVPELIRKTFRNAGLQYLVLEGRMFSARSVNPVADIDREIDIFQPDYTVRLRHKNVAILELV